MAIGYTWDVLTVDVHPTKSGKSNVVHNVHWRLIAEDDSNQDNDGNNLISSVYGTQTLDISDLSSFTNWSSLTSNDVQGWVETAMGEDAVADLKASLDAQISALINPSSVSKTLAS